MSIYEYDEEKHMRQEREAPWKEGREVGREEGIQELLKKQIQKRLSKGKSVSEIVEELEEEEVIIAELIQKTESLK
ncbi:hypothetical protein [Mediterraneibacter gnavus]|uniref:hypothetical protein n=1 Tax=Mediterraneibacter gnavus TaxID=33038 RepID=UPI0004B563A8|nr:hypothetical protein [Mediterraneibacter gnavus]